MSSKRYTVEFKAEAVKLSLKIGVYQAARELGVTSSSLYKWQKQAHPSSDSPQEAPCSLTQAEEIKALKKALARAQEERDILKKATQFFADLDK